MRAAFACELPKQGQPEEQTMSGDFSPEQKRYLEGFVAGLQIAKAARAQGSGSAPAAEPSGPDAAHLRAQDRVLKAGGKLSEQEKFKRELHPFDGYQRLKAQAANNEYPKPPDNFRWRFFGLFYVALGLWFGSNVFFTFIAAVLIFKTWETYGEMSYNERPTWLPVTAAFTKDSGTHQYLLRIFGTFANSTAKLPGIPSTIGYRE